MIRQLIGHSAAYTFANLLARGTVLVWLIVLPHFLSAADYGALGLLTTVAAIVNVVVPLEIGQALARYYPGAPEAEQQAWVNSAWTFTLLALAVAATMAFVLSEPLNRSLFGSARYLLVFRIAIAYFVLNACFVFTQNQFRWAFRPRGYTLVTAVFAIATLLLSVGLAATFADGLEGVLVGVSIGAAVGLVGGMTGLRDLLGFGIDRSRLARMLRFSLPLVPASISLLISTYASRFILNDMLALKEVGVYTWASQLASIPALLLFGVQGAITPLVMKHHAEPATPQVLARSFEAISVGALWLCVGIGLATPELIDLLGYHRFAGAGPLVMILAPANLLLQLYVFFPGFAVAERTSLQLAVSVISAVAAIIFNYWLIGLVGLIGAALASLVSSSVFLGAWIAFSHRLYAVPVQWWKLTSFVIACGGCGFIGENIGTAFLMRLLLKAALLVFLAIAAAALGFVHSGQLRTIVRDLRPKSTSA